jgi:hypothetical protein
MQRSGQIAGKVVDAKTGKALDGSDFYVYAFSTSNKKKVLSLDYWVGANGRYSLPQLRTGTYKVEFVANGSKYKTFWYGGTSFASATPISANTGTIRTLPTLKMSRAS